LAKLGSNRPTFSPSPRRISFVFANWEYPLQGDMVFGLQGSWGGVCDWTDGGGVGFSTFLFPVVKFVCLGQQFLWGVGGCRVVCGFLVFFFFWGGGALLVLCVMVFLGGGVFGIGFGGGGFAG